MYDTTWGSMQLNIYEETYQMANSSPNITEIPLIPSPTNIAGVSSIIQQGSRPRKRISFSGSVTSIADYNSLMEDANNGVTKSFLGYDNIAMDCIILFISPTINRETFWDYDLILLEV